MTFHYCFVMAQKFAPTPTPSPHSLLSFFLIFRSLVTPVSQLSRLFFSTNCSFGAECRLSDTYRKPFGLRVRYRNLSSVTMRLVFATLRHYRRMIIFLLLPHTSSPGSPSITPHSPAPSPRHSFTPLLTSLSSEQRSPLSLTLAVCRPLPRDTASDAVV